MRCCWTVTPFITATSKEDSSRRTRISNQPSKATPSYSCSNVGLGRPGAVGEGSSRKVGRGISPWFLRGSPGVARSRASRHRTSAQLDVGVLEETWLPGCQVLYLRPSRAGLPSLPPAGAHPLALPWEHQGQTYNGEPDENTEAPALLKLTAPLSASHKEGK